MKSVLLAAAAAMALVSAPAFAQQAATTNTVTFTDLADMPGLTDPSQKNHFTVGISDPQVDMQFKVDCSAGGSQLLFLHKDKVCGISGTGSVINPNNKQELPRTQYLGGFDVAQNGVANAQTIAINYLALGNVAAQSGVQFGGSMHMRASLNATGLSGIEQKISDKLGLNTTDTTIDKRLDTVTLDGFMVPGAGLPSDKGCTWDGQMVFAYQTSSWFMDLQAQCGTDKYALKGNMPWTATKGVSNQMQYDLNLTLPNANSQGDDSLFAASGNGDLFASVDGIKGTIIQKNSNNVTIKVDGQDTDTPSRVDASGSLIGTNVSLNAVRSLAVIFGILSDNLFGA